MRQPRRFTLMPAIALLALSALVTVPALSSVHLDAAAAQRYATVVVRPGDTLWAIAAAHTARANDLQAAVDRIVQVNHLDGASIQPGQRLRIPL